jgi:N-acetylglucosaminyldiphosphoundecaprenol N-acetyl-beta-D-mannosaminyltransferase
MRVPLGGLAIDALTEEAVVAHVRAALDRGIGGRIVTPNVDILRQAARDEAIRAELASADLVVADGAPLVWASRLAGTPLPARVAGSDLIWSLSAGLARDGRSVYLLGGCPDSGGARRAADRLAARVAGAWSPPFGFDVEHGDLSEVIEAKPDLVFVGIGFPRQERLIARLRPELPAAWFLGCGAAINFVAGDVHRAPRAMQRSGLEWLHRLACEPRRLANRYLRHDAPYASRLLVGSIARRARHKSAHRLLK